MKLFTWTNIRLVLMFGVVIFLYAFTSHKNATRKVTKTWPVPGGGSPDMGNISVDGKYLWLGGRYDNEVYRFNTDSGAVDKIAVGREPHGLTVWPQPGRFSFGHTGNLR